MKTRWLVLFVGVGLLGCLNPRARLQKPDETEAAKEAELRTIGDISAVAYERTDVIGVGLVVSLNGTGGGAPPASGYRDMLEKELRRRGAENPMAVLNSPNCAMVLVSATLPPGARKNDTTDVEITLPEQSRCTSLRGGYLAACKLFNFDNTARLNPSAQTPAQSLKGHDLVLAEGPLVVSDKPSRTTSDGEDESLKRARIWGGGKILVDSPIMLTLNPDQQYSRVAAQAAERINQTFSGVKSGREALAVAKSRSLVMIGVPMQYRLNLEHYLRVVRAIPLDRAPAADSAYRKKWTEQLQDPTKCLFAAIRLEALGEDSSTVLKNALTAPSPLSRFAAAQSLAYLRKPAAAEELARIIADQPRLRAPALTAMASLDESASHVRLAELMRSKDPEVRYGAFRALYLQDPRHAEISGQRLNESFWLHRVARDAEPMIHSLNSHRPEIVLFGGRQHLVPPFAISVGEEYTLVARKDDSVCTLKRFSVQHGEPVRQCSLNVADVLAALAEIGGGYCDAIDLLKKAEATGHLSCALHFDALPHPIDMQDLARLAKDDPNLRKAPAPSQGGQ